MAISGGIKYFDNNLALFAKGSTASASTGDASSSYALDRNPITYWTSVGSDDTTAETLTITFPSSTTLTRIFLIDHNFKDFEIEYDNSGWTSFSNVLGIDGSKSGIVETTFSEDTAYYEFDSVTTTQIRITATKTQTVDAEKQLNQVIVTTELGTLQGFPVIKSVNHDRNSRQKRMISGKSLIVKSEESFDTKIQFKGYPTDTGTYKNDLDLMFTLFDRNTNFLIWLCGGRYGTDYFSYGLRGFRLKDVKTVQIPRPFSVSYTKNVYQNSVNFSVLFEEVVD